MNLERVFETTQTIHRPLAEVFDFFSRAENLERITPPSLAFRILTPLPIVMRAGTLIDYKLRIRGVPVRWRTEIEKWDPPRSFVDRQLKGPYTLWHHTHTFESVDAGTTFMRDRVRYQAPFKALGLLALPLVTAEIERIFAYRRKVIAAELG